MAAGTTVPVNNPSGAGAAIVPVAADGTNGHKFVNDDGNSIIVVENPDEIALTITVTVPAEADAELVGGLVIPDRVFTTSATRYVLPRLLPKLHKQRSGDNANFMHFSVAGSDLANVTFFAIRSS
jgi:hypothetical protein